MLVTNEAAMLKLGQDFAKRLEMGDVIILKGDVGAGKSLFCQGVGKFFHLNHMPSPTFNIINEYSVPSGKLVHIDAYRINNEDLGFFDDLDAIYLIEWSEKITKLIPYISWTVEIEILPNGREVVIY